MRKIITILIAIACTVIGIIIVTSHFKSKKTQTAETTATIIRIDSQIQTDSDGFDTRWYYPVVKYNVNGKEYEARLSNSGTTNSTEYKVEDTVEIKYNPEKPEELSKKGDKGGLFGGIFLIVIGLVITITTLFRKF